MQQSLLSIYFSTDDGTRVLYLGGIDIKSGRNPNHIYELIGNSRWRKLPKALPIEIGDSRTFFPIGMDYCNGTTGFYRKGIPPLTLRDIIGVDSKDYMDYGGPTQANRGIEYPHIAYRKSRTANRDSRRSRLPQIAQPNFDIGGDRDRRFLRNL